MSSLFSFRLVPVVSLMMSRQGLDVRQLLRRHGLPMSSLSGEFLAPLERIRAFVEAAAEQLGNPVFGLDLAEQVPPGAYGYPEVLVRTSPTLGDGFRILTRYAALINPAGRFEISPEGQQTRIDYSVAHHRDGLGRHLNEHTLWFLVRSGRSIVENGYPLIRAWFPHPAPADPSQVERRLGCPVMFGRQTVGFALESALLKQRPRAADEVVHAFMEGQARALLSDVETSDIVVQLTRVIERRMGVESLDLSLVTRELGLSQRTLQRQLSGAGTGFHEVRDAARRRRAERLVVAGARPAEVAARLGYGDVRSLLRAQARWRG